MTIKPVDKIEEEEEPAALRPSPVSNSQHDQRNPARSSSFIDDTRMRRNNNSKSACNNVISKTQKLRYSNAPTGHATSSGSGILDNHLENQKNNENVTSQGTSGVNNISQLIPPTSKTAGTTCSATVTNNNNTGDAAAVVNIPSASNNNINNNINNNNGLSIPSNINIHSEDDQNTYSGYNSGDEHDGQKENLSVQEWEERDNLFKKTMCDRGFLLEEIVEDGACLFRAISLQIYGDQEMHEVIRQQTMDYIFQNREYFAQFLTEDILRYISRKRNNHVHGNHIEIQAISEIYNRPVELYSYGSDPINIFSSEQSKNGLEPLRLSYQRGSHYNAIINPYKATVGLGLGLAGYRITEESPNVTLMRDAVRLSEDLAIEQTMFEDKLKTTDWEATNEAIEEQIARESYIQWCRENQNTQNVHNHSQIISSNHQKQNLYSMNATVTSNAKDSCITPTLPSHKLQQRSSPNRCCDSGSNDVYQNTFEDAQLDIKEGEASSSKYNNKSINQYVQRKRRSTRRATTTTKISNENIPHEEGFRDCNSAFPIPIKKRKDPAEASDTQTQSDTSSSPPISDFYHSLLLSSYSDSLNGVGQRSEEEVLHRALEISRMEFVQNIMHRAGSMSP